MRGVSVTANDDAYTLLRRLHGWERAREAHGDQPGFTHCSVAASQFQWSPDRLNRALMELGARGLLAFEEGHPGDFFAAGFRLSNKGWHECSGEAELAAECTGTKTPEPVRIFISHASADKSLAEKLIALIEAALIVPDRTIRCASVKGYGLDGGDHTPDRLRAELKGCDIVLGVLTKSAVGSAYVLLELGAAWGFGKRAVPLLGADMTFDDLPGPFKEIHAVRMTDDADMADLVTTISKHTRFANVGNNAKMVTALRALTAYALEERSHSPFSESASALGLPPQTGRDVGSIDNADCIREEPDELEAILDQLLAGDRIHP